MSDAAFPVLDSEILHDCAGRLLLQARGTAAPFTLQPLSGGANNRVFRLKGSGAPLLLKAYFQHPGDPRDRLHAEFSFASFAWQNGVRALAQPLACDTQAKLGLYEFINGRTLAPGELNDSHVRQALDFFRDVNQHRGTPAAAALPLGSEACFSLSAHLACVERRVRRLREHLSGTAPSEIEREAAAFVGELSEAFSQVAASVEREAAARGVALNEELAAGDRCLSPSDFGFHNALLPADGRLRFIDFEYAGWDDPAKLVCDFFCQPAVPAPSECYAEFADGVASYTAEPQTQLWRFALLRPVYRLKWCCIMLNVFLPVDSRRRQFAAQGMQDEQGTEEAMAEQRRLQQRVQLDKAQRALHSLYED